MHGKAKGYAPNLTPEQDTLLKKRLDAGPGEEDDVCTFYGVDIIHTIHQEFGVVYTLGGIYDVLKRIRYSSLAPGRRTARKTSSRCRPLSKAPPFVQQVKQQHPGKTVRCFVSNEVPID